MKTIGRRFDAKSLLAGILVSLFAAFLFFGQQPSRAQSGVYQIEATDEGVYILNVSSGRVKYRTKAECSLYSGCQQN